ncbi:MAG: hypothetical protein ACJ741_11480 [Pyrinomonadaceae bacterium]
MGEIKKNIGWLIALVVSCVAVIAVGLLVGVGVPAWRASTRSANEAVALRTFNTIYTEERTYLHAHGSYATFDQLIAEGALDKRFVGESPVVDHYVFNLSVTPRAGTAPPSFAINANPQQTEGFNASGRRHFYTDSAKPIIHYNEERPATADDPVLGES